MPKSVGGVVESKRSPRITQEWLRQVRGQIEQHQWAIVLVPPGSDGVGYGHTIGFGEAFDCPEVLCIGLTPPETARVLNDLGALLEGMPTPALPQVVSNLIAGHDVLLQIVAMSKAAPWVNAAAAYYAAEVARGAPQRELAIAQAVLTTTQRNGTSNIAASSIVL